jgi:hypothetical protein
MRRELKNEIMLSGLSEVLFTINGEAEFYLDERKFMNYSNLFG